MSKKLLLVILALALVASAFASGTSVMTLGNVGGVVKDRSNITTFPQTVINYPYIATATFMGVGSNKIYAFGGHYQFGNGYYGLYLDNLDVNEDDMGGLYGPVVGEEGATDNVTAPKLNLFYGRELGGMPFGFNLSIYENSWKSKATNNNTERSQTYLGLGFGLTAIEKLDLSLRFRSHNFTDKGADGKDVTKPNGGMLVNIDARYWHEMDEGVYFIPHFGFEMEDQGIDVTGTGKMNLSSTDIMLGAGFSSKMFENAFFVSDLGISFGSAAFKNEPVNAPSTTRNYSYNMFPYYKFGFEGKINNWMVARFGAERVWETMSDDDKVAGFEDSGSTTNLYLGAGFKKGNFGLDLNVDPDFVNRGPYFISGSGGDWSTMASLSYTPTLK